VFLKPQQPPYDPLVWAELPLPQKSRQVCCAWAMQGYGAPLAVYLVYVIKMALYAAGWLLFCSFTPGMGRLGDVGTWWLEPIAFQKAILWSMLFEIVGLGCGSGPLTGRYVPPLGGALYFLRPGTTKLPAFPGAPLIGARRRSWLDVGLYAATCGTLLAALLAPAPTRVQIVAVALLLPALGVLDKTLFLCARGEHYWTTVMVFALASDFVPGAKAVHASLWFWAGVSKLNHHFPSVVGVMTSNSPLTRFPWVRRLMYRDYPRDLGPSRLAAWAGHAGTFLELSVPMVLLAGDGGTLTLVGLVMMLMLHGFITSNVPMGVPLEWNMMMVYGGFFLFWKHADVSVFAVSMPVAVVVMLMCVALPLLGNLYPARVPFLLAMRYYAGNWAYSVWFVRKGSHVKFERLTKSTPWIYDQAAKLYDPKTAVGMIGRVMAFRLMHLHGRALPQLVPRTIDRLQDYYWLDGEIVAGMTLGWNFGDGHLHSEQLLENLQAQCGFEEGELRCVMVESQPLGGNTMHYRIRDAAMGLIEEGEVRIDELRRTQPWGDDAAEPMDGEGGGARAGATVGAGG
jgi:hypothetical protein